MSILIYVRWYLIEVLICISLIEVLSIFSWAFCHLYVFFGEMSIWVCDYFFFNFFSLLNCMSCLYMYILEINPLLVASFPNIFSLSVGYLFILFIVSFAVVFLLSWWYYLSTKITNSDKVQFIFSFVTWAFGVVSEQVLLNPGSQRFIPVFSSKSQFLCTV